MCGRSGGRVPWLGEAALRARLLRLAVATGPSFRSHRCSQLLAHLEIYHERKHRFVAAGLCLGGSSDLGLRLGRALHTLQAAPPQQSPIPLLHPHSLPTSCYSTQGYIIGMLNANQILLYSFSSFSRQSEQ